MLTKTWSKSALLGRGVGGKETPGEEEEEEEEEEDASVVTRRRRTGDDLYANATNTNKKKRMRLRAFAREYPTYDELPGRPHEGRKPETNINGGWQPTGNEEEDFFFNNTPREPQRHTRGRRNDGNPDFYGGGIAISPSSTSSSSSFSAAARDWFELCFMALKTTVPLTAICACVAAASMNSARYTMLESSVSVGDGDDDGWGDTVRFAVFASVMSGFFVAASTRLPISEGEDEGRPDEKGGRRRVLKKKKNAGNAPPRQTQQNVVTNYEQQHHDEYIINSNEQQQSYQHQQPVQQYQQPQQQQQRQSGGTVRTSHGPSDSTTILAV